MSDLLLTKFESRSNRVKGITFHPKLSLLAAALHNGTIQLWNFQMGTLVDRFEEHEGPVRGLSFHPNRPLLASSGDDYKVKLWNYKEKRCIFTLTGHLDYVRTVFFHHELPWLISASDDQTIRIWNIESRQCLAVLTGHNHYVMCAQFHPKEDLIVSASMDQTVRVWDFSGLRKKHTSSAPMSFEEQIARANNGQADILGNTDVVVKYVLEGHDRGVNWASWHPTMPLIVSASDDRQIKIWRLSETKAWEVDSCRGHFNNICCALFHPKHELILSAGEDKSIRVWDLAKRTAIKTFRRENDRFWMLTAHPNLNLFAAGHDSGLIVFKLERERPAYTVHQNTLYYVRDKYVRVHDLNTGADNGAISVRKLGNAYLQPKTISYNPAERGIIVTSPAENGQYDIVTLPRDSGGEVKDSSTSGKRGQASSAIFIARNRFAVFDKTAQTIVIKDLLNNPVKNIACPTAVTDIFYGGTGAILMATATSVILYDVQGEKIITELTTAAIRYVTWSNDGSMVALLGKHTVTIANKSLHQTAVIHETIRVKSATWDDSGILLYSTLNHIKYSLPQGDNGIIKTLEQPVYLVRVKGKHVHVLDRSSFPRVITIDPTEYKFKLALEKGLYEEVLQIIKTSNLVGQSIIGYLQKKGYPEIALHFVQDKNTRFDLAIECGNLDAALEMARAIDKDVCWKRLAQQALKHGNHRIVEIAYQRAKDFDKLSFLYLITGNTDRLAKMSVIAERRGDNMSRFQNSLYSGAVESRVQTFRDVGMHALAYQTAKSNNLQDLADEILAEAGKTEADLPTVSSQKSQVMSPLPVITPSHLHNWPTINTGVSFFDAALAQAELESGIEAVHIEDDNLDNTAAWTNGGDHDPSSIHATRHIDEGDAWDLDEPELPQLDEPEVVPFAKEGEDTDPLAAASASSGYPETDMWVRNSPLAADHIAAGNFESAMSLLQKQAGIVNFDPLKSTFLSIYQSSRLYFTANPCMPALTTFLRRNFEETENRKILPMNFVSFERVKNTQLAAAYKFFMSAKFTEAISSFRSVLHSLLFVVATTVLEASEVDELLKTCKEYILALTLELERRRVVSEEPSDVKRALELAAYFASCSLRPEHMQIARRTAMVAFSKAQCFATAAVFGTKLLELSPPPKVIEQAQAFILAGERNPRDSMEVNFDRFTEFDVCAASLTPIYVGSPSVIDPFTKTRYLPQYSGEICRISQISRIGSAGSGLRSIA